jgi:hypothetical protein
LVDDLRLLDACRIMFIAPMRGMVASKSKPLNIA